MNHVEVFLNTEKLDAKLGHNPRSSADFVLKQFSKKPEDLYGFNELYKDGVLFRQSRNELSSFDNNALQKIRIKGGDNNGSLGNKLPIKGLN